MVSNKVGESTIYAAKAGAFIVLTNDPFDKKRLSKAIEIHKNEMEDAMHHRTKTTTRQRYWKLCQLCDIF